MVTVDVTKKDDTDRLYFKCAKCDKFTRFGDIHEIRWHNVRIPAWYCGGCYREIRQMSGANE